MKRGRDRPVASASGAGGTMAEPGRVHDDVAEVGSAKAGAVLREGITLMQSYIRRAPVVF